jgi:hypothetical protein
MLTANVRIDDIIHSGDVAPSNDTLGCRLIDNHLFSDNDMNSKLYLLSPEKILLEMEGF